MPEISRFFGIVIAMFYNDHDPPHFHAKYGSQKGQFSIDPVAMIEGDLGRRARQLVMEWATTHQDELRRDWRLAKARKPLEQIDPLE